MGGRGIFKTLQPFDDFHIGMVPKGAGVYIIYEGETPVYVGRSRVNIRQRLEVHRHGRGNWFLRLVGPTASFEYSEMMSCEQAEAQLIRELNGSGAILVQPSRVRRSYRKETKAVDRMSETPHAELYRTDSTVYISLKTWDFLVPWDSDLH